jgi:hypothetical protein
MEKQQKKSPAVLAGLFSIGTSQNNVPKATRPEKNAAGSFLFPTVVRNVYGDRSINPRHVDECAQLLLVSDSLAIKLDDD